jgi:hypothetical protein
MDVQKSLVFYNDTVSRQRWLMTAVCSSITPNTHLLPRHRKWKTIPPPLNLGSIEEEKEEYDSGYLDLGAETPSTSDSMPSYAGTPYLLARRRSFHRASSPAANKPNRLSKYAVDRDCGIWYVCAVLFVFPDFKY